MTDDRRMAFGDRLRQRRKAAQFTGKDFADRAGWQASKVSRIESGQQVISEHDLGTWCHLADLPRAEITQLRDELRGIRLDEARWKHRLRGGHQVVQDAFGDVEHSATHIRNFETGLVPGLVQTPEYAQAVFTSMSRLKKTPNDADEAVRARLRRQEALYDPGKRIELLVTETALRSPIASQETMAGQLDRLIALPGTPTIRFGIIPLATLLPAPPMHGFWILDDLVSVEVFNTEVATRDPAEVQLYIDLFESLWDVAVEGAQARNLLLHALERDYRTGDES